MISIIIPVLNAHDMTRDCLTAIRRHTHEFEVIVVDNGSDPPLEDAAIRNEKNLGFPAAVNQAIKIVKGDVIILLNNDVICTAGWAVRLLKHLDKYSIVGPVTNYCAGLQRATIPIYQDEAELNERAAEWHIRHAGQSQEVNFVIGFCMAFRKSLWEEIGPFDESLWPCSGEEIDFCLRARAAGHRVFIAHDVYVHHEGSQTFKAMDIDYDELVERNNKHLAEKWGGEFWNQQFNGQTEKGVRLNMGCGPFPLPGFLNIDQFASVKPDLVADAINLPFEPGTVDEIYAGHIIEHFVYEDGRRALRYWWTLLKPGGRISVSVPDYDYLVNEYVKNATPEKLMEFNDTFIYSGIQPSPHQYAYSAALLEKTMAEAGFVSLERMPGRHPYFPHVDHPLFPYGGGWQAGVSGVKQ